MFQGLKKFVLGLTLAATASAFAGSSKVAGAVYAMTNAAADNQVVVYNRFDDGTLQMAGSFSTGGRGGGVGGGLVAEDPLGSQGSLALSSDGRWLFAANAGSNELSAFRTGTGTLTRTAKVDSGGLFPVGITQHKNLVYVLNAGGDGNITGFTFDAFGQLRPLPGSTRTLDAAVTASPFFLFSAAEVAFTPRGDKLVVAIKGSFDPQRHRILVFDIDDLGMPSATPTTTLSLQTLSFGFAFDVAGHMIVAEPFGGNGAPGGGLGAMSSYDIASDGTLHALTTSLPNGQSASCWAAVTGDGRFVYTTNNGTSTISAYGVAADGTLRLLAGTAAHTGNAPVDLALTRNGNFLYNVNAVDGTVGMFRIDPGSGALTSLGTVPGLPPGAAGIAAR